MDRPDTFWPTPRRTDRLLPSLGAVATLAALVALAVLLVVQFALTAALLVLAVFVAALWRGASVLVVAPVLAGVLAFLAAPEAPLTYFEAHFAAPAGDVVTRFFLLFLAGAIFGRIVTDSGCAAGIARAVARRVPRALAPLAVAAVCSALTLAGVGVFVIAFAMFPIGRAVFARFELPLALVPATIGFGAFTVTMTALPGAPSLTNIVAAAALGTSAFAAPLPGLAAAVAMALTGGAWLTVRAMRTREVQVSPESDGAAALVPARRAVLPLLCAVLANASLTAVFVRGDPAQFGAFGPAYCAALIAVALGTLLACRIGGTVATGATVNAGAASAAVPLLGTAVGIGFGAALAAHPDIAGLIDRLTGLASGDATLAAAIRAGLFAGAVGSSSGGMALWAHGFAAEALAAGADPAALHRLTALATTVLDTLPHSGAVIALLAICGRRHADAYGDIFAVTVLAPAVGLAVGLAVA